MSIDLLGIKINATVWDGIWKMATEGYPYTAFMVLVCAVIMPIAFVLLILTIQLQRIIRQRPRYTLIFLTKIKEWVMLDVYLVALAVAAFKIRDYADLQFDINLIAFVLVTLLNTLLLLKPSQNKHGNVFTQNITPCRLITQAIQHFARPVNIALMKLF